MAQQEDTLGALDERVFDNSKPYSGRLIRQKRRAFRLRGTGKSATEAKDETGETGEDGEDGEEGDAGDAAEAGTEPGKESGKEGGKEAGKDKGKKPVEGRCEACGKGPETDEIEKLQQRIQKLDFTIACLMRLVQVMS